MNASPLRALPVSLRPLRGCALAAALASSACMVTGGQALARPNPVARTERAIRACVNQERTKRGLRPLKDNRVLDRAAHFHASNMAKFNFFAHTDIWRHDPFARIAAFDTRHTLDYPQGENIAAGDGSARAACVAWMHSAGHRANILDPDYTVMGAGFARSRRGYRTYFVQDFGVLKAVSPPAGGPGGGSGGGSTTTHHVTLHLFNVDDQETVYLNGGEVASVGYGQTSDVDLGQLSASDQVTVTVDNFAGGYSWGITEVSDGQTVLDDEAGSVGSYGANGNDQSSTGTVHRLTFDASGTISDTYTVQP